MTASNASVLVTVRHNALMAVKWLAYCCRDWPDTGVYLGFGWLDVAVAAVFWQG